MIYRWISDGETFKRDGDKYTYISGYRIGATYSWKLMSMEASLKKGRFVLLGFKEYLKLLK